MEQKRRTQGERSAATREALTTAARRLWGERGFAEVGTPEIAREAGVTRGAMYHQFADKIALFVAVIEDVEQRVMDELATGVAAARPATPAAALRAALDQWLTICVDPEVRQLVLLDAPSVLGWARFRALTQDYSLGMTEQLLRAAMDAGQLAPQPVRPLAHVLIGALDEGAMVIAGADDRERARREVREVLLRLVDALLTDPG
ncbi:TetR/AcrR family transcriptional regulator [Actinomycetospora callitridis]|uniref:TetR/AcrR family transcriptional regulator n=1 Tax=Actinomycetospora callitridis TaxID=913944 RepID=UPI002367190E|nr:TetR/AcrR family transcriptional regulator [Actinomycetospora callitridis]MDD7920850.1 TetR/AcrR family transcriptional regulator [Actinomycetospora callitridis]